MAAAIAQAPGQGSRLQLAARGAQDVYLLSSDPKTTLWRSTWRRHAAFATKVADTRLFYTPGKRSSVELPKSGDALADVTLEIHVPAVADAGTARWVPRLGYALLRRVRLIIDDTEVHNIERLWYDMYDKLHTTEAHAPGLASMIGESSLPMTEPHVLYVPLRFLSNRKGSARAALPLYAMPRARIAVDVDFERLEILAPAYQGNSLDPDAFRINVLAELVEVDEAEKRRMLEPTTLTFESVIDCDGLSYRHDNDGDITDLETITVDLSPATKTVKALAWVAYDEQDPRLFEYLPGAVSSVEIMFDGMPREREKPSGYYDIVQSYNHCARSNPPDGVGVYSFALDATNRHATGAADFAAIARPTLRATVAHPGPPRFKLKVFALYYNYLELQGGTVRVVFT